MNSPNNRSDTSHQDDHTPAPHSACPGQDGNRSGIDNSPSGSPVAFPHGNSAHSEGNQPKPENGDPVNSAFRQWAAMYTQDPAIAATAARIAEVGASSLLTRAIQVLGDPEEFRGQYLEDLTTNIVGCATDELGSWGGAKIRAIVEEHFGLSQPAESRQGGDPAAGASDQPHPAPRKDQHLPLA